MVNKLIFICASSILAGVLLFGRDMATYFVASAGRISETVQSQIPVEFELHRAERMISDLSPQIHDIMRRLAREEIEVERLTARISILEDRQAEGNVSLRRLQHELESGRDQIRIGSTEYNAAEAKRVAQARLQRYKTDEITLGLLRQACTSRLRALDSARQKLQSMQAAKQQLLAEVANLKARLMLRQIERSSGKSSFDEIHLARTRELISDIEARLDVEERIAEVEADFVDDLLQYDADESKDIAAQIAEYFGGRLEVESGRSVTALAESRP